MLRKRSNSLNFGLTHVVAEPKMTDLDFKIIKSHEIDTKKLKYITKIGKGSSALIYKGEYNNKIVCIKELLSEKKKVKRYYYSFLKEIVNLSFVEHKNCIKFFGCYNGEKSSSKTLLLTNYCTRGDLYTLLSKNDEYLLKIENKMKIIKEVAEGFHYLHQNDFVHGDVKSLNILLDESNNPFICDFGFLQKKKKNENEDVLISRGTIKWMAPESLRICKPKINFKSDVWSFGVICWEIFSLEKPYCKKDVLEVKKLVPLGLLKLKIDQSWNEKVKTILDRCFCLNEEKRCDFKEILEILKD